MNVEKLKIKIFLSKSHVLDHFEFIDVNIEKLLKNTHFLCRCPQKNGFCPTGAVGGSENCRHARNFYYSLLERRPKKTLFGTCDNADKLF